MSATLTFHQPDGSKSTIKVSYVLEVSDGHFWTGKDSDGTWWIGFLDGNNRIFSFYLNPLYANRVVRQVQD